MKPVIGLGIYVIIGCLFETCVYKHTDYYSLLTKRMIAHYSSKELSANEVDNKVDDVILIASYVNIFAWPVMFLLMAYGSLKGE